MHRFIEKIISALDGEEVIAMCIGKGTWDIDDHKILKHLQKKFPLIPFFDIKKATPRKTHEAKELYIWTETRVLFVYEYDSMFGINSLPRNPIECNPQFNGTNEYHMKKFYA